MDYSLDWSYGVIDCKVRASGSRVDVVENAMVAVDEDILHAIVVIGDYIVHESVTLVLVEVLTKCSIIKNDKWGVHLEVFKPYVES